MKIAKIYRMGINSYFAFYTEGAHGRGPTVYNLFTGECKVLDEGQDIPDDFVMKIPFDLGQELFKAMAEFASEQGIKLDADLKREGQLEATKYHLEDMRALLKLRKP